MEPVSSTCVCTSLRMATRMVARVYDRALAPVGLRATGYAVLARLQEEGPLTVGDLAARLVLEQSTCSREVALLVKAGLVTATIGDDRRHRNLSISAAGRARLAGARRHQQRVQEEVRALFGAGETDELLEALRGIVVVGRKLEEAPPS